MTADPISDIHVDWEPRAALVAMEQLRPMEELAYRRILDLIYVHGNRLIDDDRYEDTVE